MLQFFEIQYALRFKYLENCKGKEKRKTVSRIGQKKTKESKNTAKIKDAW
jgi:hypothetical protein